MLRFMKTNISTLLFFFLIVNSAYSQLGVKETNTVPNSKAMLDVESTNKGVLIPRMSTGSRDVIESPPAGLMIYNSTTNDFNYWNGIVWTDFNSAVLNLPFNGQGVNIFGGEQGLMQISNIGTGTGLVVRVGLGGQLLSGQSFGGYFASSENGIFSSSGVGKRALVTAGGLQFGANNGGINRILTSIDASGTATWQSTANLTGLEVNGGTKLGVNGTSITEIIKITMSGNIGNMLAGTVGTITFSVPNAQVGSTVHISPSVNLPAGIVFSHALVEAAGAVEVKYFNASASPIDPAAQNYHITIIR